MGFPDLTTDAGLTVLNDWLHTRSYITSDSPSQADVACFKATLSAPDSSRYPHAAKWYELIASLENDVVALPGDASKAYTAYGPDLSSDVAPATATAASGDDDELDLFGSDEEEEEDAEAARVREERLAAYKEKKAAKPKAAAKSIVMMEVKGWDDETDMVALEAAVRGIEKDGLVWGTSQLVPVGFGIHKLQINLVVEDEKISTVDLQEEIEGFEDYVQSSDIVGMQKL
ncbi:hypothetical protein HK57_00641 [Aspergillus ustus]|uniref:Elongation factor 1-beta n=1 Tax=Aspergillus ustus TaxID=40382 RepID=A0A0C1E201_ASPUT|nr:hypothetical protein HK57_00641 [Aspergillus ustus]